ncbi:MAG: alanine--tRNA ligase [Thermoleophilaceae bacterium]
MRAAEIRQRYLSFFEERGHRRIPSASLVPPTYDPSVLLTTAGMQPFKPYFRGDEHPPQSRLTSCQKCFRTTDIENVGQTARHLTFFEMLGNFSFGDYFKGEAVGFALELSTEGFGFALDDIWVTVFGGDPDLGLGPDEEAIGFWQDVGVQPERIVALGRADNFWQAGPSGPCGPCSELYLDRGDAYGSPDERPGDDSERFLEFWNLVFMQHELHEDGSLTPLPARCIDTGLGLDRLAAILQNAPSVFETDHVRPIVALGEELSGRLYGSDEPTTRALRILADHGRGMTFLLADGVVPSNEDRGYILRRIMRRAIQQGRVLGLDDPFLTPLCERVIEVMGEAYPELRREAQTIAKWAAAEDEGFRRTLAQGERMLSDLVRRAKESETVWIAAEDAFALHDTYGFPYELTRELLAAEGLSVDDQGFEELMERAREVARGGASTRRAQGTRHERVQAFARAAASATRFIGYESLEAETVAEAVERMNGEALVKLAESPFYAEGGGQVSDGGVLESASGTSVVEHVFRLGDDQALALRLDHGRLEAGQAVRVRVDRGRRHATMCNHTATHLLHAALRELLGPHVRQAGSYVGPDKLRFDFTHGERLSADELAAVEHRVNDWIGENHPVRAIEMARPEAEALGAMALFGEKYGDWVRMVEVDGVSRELCGGTHVSSTAEIGLFNLLSESSSASNVRRIEAETGPAATATAGERSRALRDVAALLRVPEREVVRAVKKLSEEARLKAKKRPRTDDRELAEDLIAAAEQIDGVRVVTQVVEVADQRALLELSDQVKQSLGDAAVVLGTIAAGRVHLVANFTPAAVERGARAGEVVRAAAQVAGGGGGGRDTMAQAGGKLPDKLPEALVAARLALERALT